jgi:hypothetical protein
MDTTALAAFVIAGHTAETQLAFAAKMLRLNAQTAQNAVTLIEAAAENFDRLANVAPGIGENLDVSA